MRYLLNREYALRSFIDMPYCYYKKDRVHAKKLDREEFEYLLLCDGAHDLPDLHTQTEQVRSMIHPASDGEVLSSWQRYRHCDNRYFPSIIWMITGKCNYNCLHCFNAADLSPLAEEWSPEDARILLDEAADCGIHAFTLTGGEPLLHPSFMDIVSGIYERGMAINELNTNGAYITRDLLQDLVRIGAIPLMKISFDGLGRHDWLRNHKGAEERTLNAIRLCIDAGFPVKVQYNLHRKNIDTLPESLSYLEDMGVSQTRIIRTSEAPRWTQMGQGQTLSFREYYEAILSLAKTWLKTPHRMSVPVWLMGTLPSVDESAPSQEGSGDSSEWSKLERFRPQSFICPDCRFLTAITAEGDLVPCLQMSGRFHQEGWQLGNVKGGGLQQQLRESTYLDTVCMTVGDLLKDNSSCANCSHFLDCQGGCRAIAVITGGDYKGIDLSKCIYYKEGYADRWNALLEGRDI